MTRFDIDEFTRACSEAAGPEIDRLPRDLFERAGRRRPGHAFAPLDRRHVADPRPDRPRRAPRRIGTGADPDAAGRPSVRER